MRGLQSVLNEFALSGLKPNIVLVWRHGDDFVNLGDREACAKFSQALGQHLIVKVRGTLGPRPECRDVQELSVLNRLVRWVRTEGSEQVEYEPDPRHVELLLRQLGLEGASAKAQVNPGQKVAAGSEWTLEAPLGSEEAAVYRSVCMRCAYLAQDRPELQYPTKEAARVMHAPTVAGWNVLKRIGRFLKGCPRVVAVYRKQQLPTNLSVYSDTDHQGCPRTRHSTSCTAVMLGGHWIKSSATTQKGISLSSGESEFHGIVKSACFGLGFRTLLHDWAVGISVQLMVDATAGKGIAERRGVGKVRHLHASLLWVQKVVEKRELAIRKIPRAQNVADLGTHFVDTATMWAHLTNLGFERREGQSRIALKAA